jgi:hypothetical protein
MPSRMRRSEPGYNTRFPGLLRRFSSSSALFPSLRTPQLRETQNGHDRSGVIPGARWHPEGAASGTHHRGWDVPISGVARTRGSRRVFVDDSAMILSVSLIPDRSRAPSALLAPAARVVFRAVVVFISNPPEIQSRPPSRPRARAGRCRPTARATRTGALRRRWQHHPP